MVLEGEKEEREEDRMWAALGVYRFAAVSIQRTGGAVTHVTHCAATRSDYGAHDYICTNILLLVLCSTE